MRWLQHLWHLEEYEYMARRYHWGSFFGGFRDSRDGCDLSQFSRMLADTEGSCFCDEEGLQVPRWIVSLKVPKAILDFFLGKWNDVMSGIGEMQRHAKTWELLAYGREKVAIDQVSHSYSDIYITPNNMVVYVTNDSGHWIILAIWQYPSCHCSMLNDILKGGVGWVRDGDMSSLLLTDGEQGGALDSRFSTIERAWSVF